MKNQFALGEKACIRAFIIIIAAARAFWINWVKAFAMCKKACILSMSQHHTHNEEHEMNTQRNADQTLLENTEYQYFIFHADTGEVSSGWS